MRPPSHLRSLLQLAAALSGCPVALLYELSVDDGERAVLLEAFGPQEMATAAARELPSWRLRRDRVTVVPEVGQGPAAPESVVLPRALCASLVSMPIGRRGPQLFTLVLADLVVREDLEDLDRSALETFGELLLDALAPLPEARPSTPPPPKRERQATLIGRREILPRLERTLRDRSREEGGLAVVLVSLDRFRRINDWLGNGVGDELLRQVGERLKALSGDRDLVGRTSGDELLVAFREPDADRAAPALAHRLLQAIEEPFYVQGYDLTISACLGVARYPADGERLDTLLRYAGIALHRAKERGRGRLQVFTPQMREAVERRGDLERQLRQALGRGELTIFYQPKVDLATRAVVGVEALLRWRQGQQLIPPSEFIPVAEESGLIVPIGALCLLESCRQLRRWLDEGLDFKSVAVNVSPHQFSRPGFVGTVERALTASRLPPARLELEVTESSLMTDVEDAAMRLAALRRLGVRVAVDDFGTGYSSLAYLQRLPVDVLKVDRSFVKDLDGGTRAAQAARSLAGAIVGLGRALGLRVLAEGVETEAQLHAVAELGYEEVQGYLFGRPVPPAELPRLALGLRRRAVQA